jgi:hypothetical protein
MRKNICMEFSYTHSLQFLFLLILTGISNSLTGQQNGGFENWSPSGSPPPFDWKFPTGWTTTNATAEFNGAGVTRSTDAYAGTYAAQLRTLNIFGTITRSQLALGNAKLDFPTYSLIGYTGGEPLTMIPQEVSFFYKLTTGDTAENAVVDILIKRREPGDHYPDTVYYESRYLEATSSYTEVNIPIPSENINTETDSIVIVFSSNDTNETALNLLYVDEVSIDFVSAVDHTSGQQDIFKLYPNPVYVNQSISVSGSPVKTITITDLKGNVVFANNKSFEGKIDLQGNGISAGMYLIHLNGANTIPIVILE